MLAGMIYLFTVFLEWWSWQFLLATLVTLILFLPSQYSRWWLLATASLLLFGAVLFSCLNASYFVASDQFRFRLRSVEGATFFEFQADNPIGRMLVSKFSAKTIVVKECDGQKVALLPRLHYPAIAPSGPSFADKIYFRRFPDLKVDVIEAGVRATAKPFKDVWGENRKDLALEFGLNETEFRSVKVTDIFPRSTGCIEESVPLLPLVETLPWDPDDVGDMVMSAKRVARLFSIGITRKLTPNDLVELKTEIPPNKYGVLIDFLAHSLAYQMLDGNVFAEARAQIQGGQCNLINRDGNAFLGPFSTFKERLYVTIATDLGKLAYPALPSCHIPAELIDKSEDKKSGDQKPDQQALLDCLSDRANPLPYCDLVTKSARISAERSAIPISQQIADFELRDKEFDDVVIDEKGERRVIEKIEPNSCPVLRDVFEERQFVVNWQSRSSTILEKRFDCSSANWKNDFERAHSSYKAAQECSISRHLFPETEGSIQANGLDTFDYLWNLRCNADHLQSLKPSLKEQLRALADSYDKANKLDLIVAKLGSFEKIAGSERVSEIVSAVLQLKSIVALYCGNDSLRNCIERYDSQQTSREEFDEKSKAMFHLLGVDLLTQNDPKMPQLYAQLKSLHNYFVNIGICNFGSSPIVVKELKMSDEEICADVGLGQYLALRKTSLASDQLAKIMLMSPETLFEADLSLH